MNLDLLSKIPIQMQRFFQDWQIQNKYLQQGLQCLMVFTVACLSLPIFLFCFILSFIIVAFETIINHFWKSNEEEKKDEEP